MTAHTLPGLEPTPRREPLRVTANPRHALCPDCGAAIVTAWRDRVMEDVLADQVSLTALGELQALTEGRRTFDHWIDGLDLRTAWVIARSPAGTGNAVRPEHRCGSPPTHLDTLPERLAPIADPDAPPPF